MVDGDGDGRHDRLRSEAAEAGGAGECAEQAAARGVRRSSQLVAAAVEIVARSAALPPEYYLRVLKLGIFEICRLLVICSTFLHFRTLIILE